ncbi:MAG: hypothetical protein AAF235_02765, partial [Planctomycetota bacterium]
ENVTKIVEAIEQLAAKVGKAKRDYEVCVAKEELLEVGYQVAGDRIEDAIYAPSKIERGKKVGALRDEVEAAIKEKYPDVTDFEIEQVFEYIQKKAFRISIMEKNKRADGRAPEDLRPLFGEVGSLPQVHGSAIFARGETMAMGIATLAPGDEKQYLDNYAGGESEKRFILHYNFPPFSVGETGRMGGLNRREIGHGALAERSIVPVLPDEDDFPYAIRVSSEVMESNGSTSILPRFHGRERFLSGQSWPDPRHRNLTRPDGKCQRANRDAFARGAAHPNDTLQKPGGMRPVAVTRR